MQVKKTLRRKECTFGTIISTIDRELIRHSIFLLGGEKVNITLSLLRNFRLPDGKIQQCRGGVNEIFIAGKLEIYGMQIRIQTMVGDGRNAQ